jgi:hypothetical protein
MSDSKERADTAPAKKPYERPTVTWEEQMQNRPSLMAACAKITGQDATCNAAAGAS